ncbi:MULTISPECIES: NAD(P)-dependent oxidoreductase [unclassified Nonomuraea]|uniref:NAD(P)-dependent oxidoreductase n=1 Tax=unclassified Nonomuraea TaxID=2593643 RepID=UPI0035C065D2
MKRLAFLGLGGMGAGMALRLLDCGHDLVVHNRTPEKAAPVAAAGGVIAASPAGAVAGADAVVVSLADQAAVERVVLGDALAALRPGAYVIDTSTLSPAFSRTVTERLAAAGVRRVEACVLGNPAQAREGLLRVLAAGPAADVDAVEPVLESLGHQVVRVGDTGSAAVMKLAFNLLIGAQVASLAEAVALGVGAGLDRGELLTAIKESGFSSLVMGFRADIMQRRDYVPAAFRTRLMAKDLRFALDEAERAGLALPVTRRAAERFEQVIGAGDGEADAAVLVEHPQLITQVIT